MNTREHDGRALYREWSKDLMVPPWEDLSETRRERWRRIAEAMRLMFQARFGTEGPGATTGGRNERAHRTTAER